MSGLTCQIISQTAVEYGFSAAYCFPPQPEDSAPEAVRTLVLLARDYIPGGGLVDLFYPCSNTAYHRAKEMAASLTERWGIGVFSLSNLRMKPMCHRLPAFGTGLNTLNYLEGYGSRFCLELLGLSEEIDSEPMPVYDRAHLPCAACKRCMAACPTGAITENGFIKERCIRFHMMNGKPMPEDMRRHIGRENGARGVLGCDICQRVCPANAERETLRRQEDAFTLKELLFCDKNTLARFGALYGVNYAIRNRIIAQAALAAANRKQTELIGDVRALADSPSPAVAAHAAWALQNIEEIRKNY